MRRCLIQTRVSKERSSRCAISIFYTRFGNVQLWFLFSFLLYSQRAHTRPPTQSPARTSNKHQLSISREIKNPLGVRLGLWSIPSLRTRLHISDAHRFSKYPESVYQLSPLCSVPPSLFLSQFTPPSALHLLIPNTQFQK